MKTSFPVALALLLSCLAPGLTSAQVTLEDDIDPSWGLIVGINVWELLGFQLGGGYIFNQSCTEAFCFSEGVGMTVEVIPGETPVVGTRAVVWTSRVLSAGLGVGFYTDFEKSSLLLQPEVGLGFSGVRISFRINVPNSVDLKRAADVEMTASGFLPF